MENKPFELFFLYCVKADEKDMHTLLARWTGSFVFEHELILRPLQEYDQMINEKGQEYFMRLFYGRKDSLSKDTKYIQLILRSNAGVEYEEMKPRKRKIRNSQANFLFNVEFMENAKQSSFRFPPQTLVLSKKRQFDFFISKAEFHELNEAFFTGSKHLLDKRDTREIEIYLEMLRGTIYYESIFFKHLLNFELTFFIYSSESQLEKFQTMFEIIKEDNYINTLLQKVCDAKKKEIREDAKKVRHNYNILIPTFFLKTRQFDLFLSFLKNHEIIEDIIYEYSNLEQFCTFDENEIFDIANLFRNKKCSAKFLACLISLAKSTALKLQIIFNQWKILLQFLGNKKTDKLRFLDMLNKNDFKQENIIFILEQLGLIFQQDEQRPVSFDPSKFNNWTEEQTEMSDIIEINISELLSRFTQSCEDLRILNEMYSFLVNYDKKINDISKENTKTVIKRKMNSSIINLLSEKCEVFSYLTKIKFIHENYPDFLRDKLTGNYAKTIVELSSSFSLDEINEGILEFLRTIRIRDIFPMERYKDFISNVFRKVQRIDQIDILFKLFPLEDIMTYSDDTHQYISRELITIFSRLCDSNPNERRCIEVYQHIITYIKANDDMQFENLFAKLIDSLFKNLESLEKFILIHINLILESNDGTITNIVVDRINCRMKDIPLTLAMTVLLKIFNLSSFDEKILDANKKQLYLSNVLFSNMSKHIIREDDFYAKDFTDRVKALYDAIKCGIFDHDCIKSTLYVISTTKLLQNIRCNIKESNLKFYSVYMLKKFSKESLIKKLFILCWENESELDEFLQHANTLIQSTEDIQISLEDMVLFFASYFHKENFEIKKHMEEIEKIKEMISDKPFSEISTYYERVVIIKQYSLVAKRFNSLYSSKIFRMMFKNAKIEEMNDVTPHKEKIEDIATVLSHCYDKFLRLDKLLDINTFYTYTVFEIEELFREIQGSARNEIAFLKSYFHLENNPTGFIEKTLKVLSSRNLTVQKFSKMTKLLAIFKIKDSRLFDDNENNKNFLFNLNVNTLEYLNNYNKIIDNGFDFLEDNELFSLIELLVNNPALIEFLEGKKEDDIRGLVEFVDDIGDSFIKVESIKDLVKVLSFIIDLRSNNDDLYDIAFIKKLQELSALPKNSKMVAYVQSVIENINGIKQLYSKIVNREEYSKIKIKEIYQSSLFEFYHMNKGYNVRVIYGIEYNNKCDLDEIIELRDRSFLLSKKKITDKHALAEGQNFDEDEELFIEICKNFSLIVDEISHLLLNVNELYAKGYPKLFVMTIFVNRTDIEVEIGNRKASLQQIKEEITRILELFNQELMYTYENYTMMTFFYGRQFQEIYEFLLSMKQDCNSAKGLIHYISNKKITKYTPADLKISFQNLLFEQMHTNEIRAMFDVVNTYLEICLMHSHVNISNILEANLIRGDHIPGIYCYLVSDLTMELEVLHAYLVLTGNIPLFQTILICNESTSKEHIISFIYRSIKFPHKVPFFIIKADCLNLEKRMDIAFNVKDLYMRYGNEMQSSLVFAYSDKDSDLIDQIKKIQGWKKISYEKLDNQYVTDFTRERLSHIEIISSDASGVGKSTYIKTLTNQIEYKYVLFPIGGEVTCENILKRLKNLNLRKRNTVLHIDFSDTSNIPMLKDFLFSFLITGGICVNDEIFLLDDNIKIKIELPYGFVDFLHKFPLLNLFSNHIISKNELPPMIILQNEKSNMQIVANYLQSYDKGTIKNKNIYISCQCENSQCHSDTCPFYSSVSLVRIRDDECQSLIKKYFSIQSPTYYHLQSFINILADQFIKLSHNLYFSVLQLSNRGKKYLEYRKLLVKYLIDLTKYFTSGAYSELIMSQNLTYRQYHMLIEYNEQEETAKAFEALEKKKIISFDQIPYSLVFFNEDGQSISIITTSEKKSTEYNLLRELWNSGGEGCNMELIDYRKLNHISFLEEVGKVLGKPVSPKETEGYVFTVDNFIKMILILLRVRAKIPVIMMGETGCGKTSLIKIISKLKCNNMKILNIHNGITDDQIISFITTHVIPCITPGQTMWVFLDEINTCQCMGLISEIMCKKTMQGEPLPDNITFIAACNPYRKFTNQRIVDTGLVKKKEHHVRQLVYNVNPLPHSLLNFVFDFGHLKDLDERRYIESMLQMDITDDEYRKMAVNAIISAQVFIRALNEVSSVSLRDVRRFGIFYRWFIKSIIDRKNLPKNEKDNYSSLTTNEIIFRSIVLSLFICYYFRIPEKREREKFKLVLCDSLIQDNFLYIPQQLIEEIFEQEMNDIVRRIQPPKGIALNNALLENLLTLFVCINNKIPVFLCGKPGCSKTLSVQLLYSSMRGPDSNDEYFKKLPRLFMNCYQGSLTSTSAGVVKVFDKARKFLKDSNSGEIISLIFFDEMGLAEISKNNPLKVIHSELEYDIYEKQEKEKVAFVGISNWRLDASKMNRGIFLSRPDPDENDLIQTAITIAQSYEDDQIKGNEYIFKNLAQTYFRYKHQLSEKAKDKEDFHGARDFYHLIKQVSRNIISEGKIDKYSLESRAWDALERNFGGLEDSIELIKKIYKSVHPNSNIFVTEQYEVMNCIRENILDEHSRYLILISKSSISPYLLGSILDEQNIDSSFFIGSKFDYDIEQEDYSFKILNKIQSCMERGKMLVLKNLEMIYPSLYDLFNQNFCVVGGKNYARIALGTSNNPMAYVNEKFRCAILIDQDELNYQDPPFLNRFEKHIISYEVLLPKKFIKLAKEDINGMLKAMTQFSADNPIAVRLDCQLVNCDDEEILGMIYQCYKNQYTDHHKIIMEVFGKIVPTFSQDVISSLKFSNFNKTQNREFIEVIYDLYSKCYNHRNLESYLNSTENPKNVIYTFSSILDNLTMKSDITHPIVGKYNEENIVEVTIHSFKSENQLDCFINSFFKNDKKKILIVKFRPSDCKHMNLAKFLIDNIQKENKYQEKIIIFTVHLLRIMDKDEIREDSLPRNKDLISHLSNYSQVFIDNLNAEFTNQITDLIHYKPLEFFHEKELFDIEEAFPRCLYSSLMKIIYNFRNGEHESDYRSLLIEKILQNQRIKSTFERVIFTYIAENYDIIREILTSRNFLKKDIDMISSIKLYMHNFFEETLTKFLVNLELLDAIEFCLYLPKDDSFLHDWLLSIWEDLLMQVKLSEIKVNQSNLENLVTRVRGVNIPFLQNTVKELMPKIHMYCDEFLVNEDSLRFSRLDEREIERQLKEMKREQKEMVESTVREMENFEMFRKLMSVESNNSSASAIRISEYILNDFIKIFLATQGLDSGYAERLIKLMIDHKFSIKSYHSSKEYLANIFLWLQAYSPILQAFLRILDTLAIHQPEVDIVHCVENLIQFKVVYYNFKDTIRLYKKEVNEVFFLVHEAFLSLSLPGKELLDSMNLEDFYTYLQCLKNICQESSNLEYRLLLYTKELTGVQNFLTFQELAENACDPFKVKEILHNIISFQQNESLILREFDDKKQEERLLVSLEEQLEFFKRILGNQKEKYAEFMVDFCVGKFIKISSVEYRYRMLKFLLSDEVFIRHSKKYIEQVIRKFELMIPYNKEDCDNDEAVEAFCSFALDHDECLEQFEILNSKWLDEILIYLFEWKIMKYFDRINTEENLIFDLSLEYFNKSILHLESYYHKENKFDYTYPRLAVLYSISYIKIYISKYVKCLYYKNPDHNFGQIHKIICGEGDNPVRRMIKTYILKSLRLHMNSYEDFTSFQFIKHQILWIKEFIFQEESPFYLDYLFLSQSRIEQYNILANQFMNLQQQQFRTSALDEEILQVIGNANLDIFLDITINKIFSNTLIGDFTQKQLYNEFSIWVQNFLQGVDCSMNTRKLLHLFFSKDEYLHKIYPLMENKKSEFMEMLFLGYKLSLICFTSPEQNIYGNLTNSEHMYDSFQSSYIPGAENSEIRLVQSYKEIKEFLSTHTSYSHGVYICSCGSWYEIGPCGSPAMISTCDHCNQDIGGQDHVLIKREGHYRVYINSNHRTLVETCWPADKENSNKLFEELGMEIEKIITLEGKGISKVSFAHFANLNKMVRNLKSIPYRVLSFILYSILFYSHYIGLLLEEELGSMMIENESFLHILEVNWSILKQYLTEKGINDMTIFFHLVIDFIRPLISNYPICSTNKERMEFEEIINNIIDEVIKSYDTLSSSYKSVSNSLLQNDATSMKFLIHEKEDWRFCNSKLFPYIEYFRIARYPSEEDMAIKLKSCEDHQKKYPVLSTYIENKHKLQKLDNVKLINPLVNYMIQHFSYKISRPDAKKSENSIANVLSLIHDGYVDQLFVSFTRGWSKIYRDATKYQCKPHMQPKNITDHDPLAYILNDNGEIEFGMYLAAAYQNFITYQNDFIRNILSNISQSGIVHYYKENLNKEIVIQDAAPNEVLSLSLDEEFENLSEFARYFSFRKIFSQSEINYNSYQDIVYYFDEIEEELAKKILPGKKLFSENQRFVTFAYEGYRGDKSAILLTLTKNIPQESLSQNEKNALAVFCEETRSIDKMLNALQMLLFYIHKKNIVASTLISNVINALPEYISIGRELTWLFEHNQFQISKIVDIYEHIELLCYHKILENVSDDYKLDIKQDMKETIERYFANEENLLIKKSIMATVIRKFISRFLSGKLGIEEIKANENVLLLVQYKPDLWNREIYDDKKFMIEFEFLLELMDVKVNQSVVFYEILGGDPTMVQRPSPDEGRPAQRRQPPRRRGGTIY